MTTFFTFFLLASATLGAHRLYNYESIFDRVRRGVGHHWMLKPIWCVNCNPFWIAVVLLTGFMLLPDPWSTVYLVPLAIYPWIRATSWVYAYASKMVGLPPASVTPSAPSVKVEPITIALTPGQTSMAAPQAQVKAAEPEAACAPCEAGKKNAEEIKKVHTKNLAYEKRFVLMTPMISNWDPSYSLATVILDQARMLAANEKWLVQIWVTTVCNLDGLPTDFPANIEIKKALPPIPLTADHVDEKAKAIFFGQVLPHLMVLGNATIIAHDLLFVSSYLTVAAAIHEQVGGIAGFEWFHFCHSAPAGLRAPVDSPVRYRTSLPSGHRLLCLAESQVSALAQYYGVDEARVTVVPNARDVRTLLSASPRIWSFIRETQLLDADIVQVFPLSTPRAGAKGLSTVIKIFAELAKTRKVRLIVANAHANNNDQMVIGLRKDALAAGLPDDALVFTSRALPETAVHGLPTAELQVLFQLSNLFVFPTISEACSMTLMEAAAAGCHLVLNASTRSLFDIIPMDMCRAYRWGSLTDDLRGTTEPDPADVAMLIRNDLDSDLSNRSKRSVLRTQNLDAIGVRLRAAVTADRTT